ncbi:MAG TPA: zinc-binding dehydrogenase [Clostridium sp.]
MATEGVSNSIQDWQCNKEADILGMAILNVHPDEYKESLYAVSAFLQSGILYPEVGEEFSLEDASKVHKQIISKKAHGKMILSID